MHPVITNNISSDNYVTLITLQWHSSFKEYLSCFITEHWNDIVTLITSFQCSVIKQGKYSLKELCHSNVL
jgi:hypothetical protein